MAGFVTLSNDMVNSAIPPAIDIKYGNERHKKSRIFSIIYKIVSCGGQHRHGIKLLFDKKIV